MRSWKQKAQVFFLTNRLCIHLLVMKKKQYSLLTQQELLSLPWPGTGTPSDVFTWPGVPESAYKIQVPGKNRRFALTLPLVWPFIPTAGRLVPLPARAASMFLLPARVPGAAVSLLPVHGVRCGAGTAGVLLALRCCCRQGVVGLSADLAQ